MGKNKPKEDLAGCGLKKIGSAIFFHFCICNIHGIPGIFIYKKNIPHSDCSEIGAISKYVSNIAFYKKYIGNNSTFPTKFEKKRILKIKKKHEHKVNIDTYIFISLCINV